VASRAEHVAVTRTRRHRAVSLALAAVTALAVASCGESSQARTCDRMDGVRSAVQDLRNVNLAENGMVALQGGLAEVKSELGLLRAELSQDLQPQVDAVKTSVDQVQNAVAAAKANPTAASLSAVRNNLEGLGATVGNLGKVVAATC
jgi:hypothetical protein